MVDQCHQTGRDEHLGDAQTVIAEHGPLIAALVAENHGVVGVKVGKRGTDPCHHRREKLRVFPGPAAEKAEHQVKHQQIDQGGAERAQKEFEHHLEDAPGILDGVVVGAVVLLVVHGLNGLLHKADAHALHLQEHVGLILKAFSLDGAEALQAGAGNGPQAGLGIGELDAIADAEKPGCGAVARHTAGRHAGQGEIPAAHDHLVPLVQHPLAAGYDIFQQVLAVPVDGDHAPDLRQLFQHVSEGGFQRAALALVHPVVQHVALGVFLCFIEPVHMLAVAAVVHDHDMFKAVLRKPVHHAFEFVIRVQGGENDCKSLLTALSFCHICFLP